MKKIRKSILETGLNPTKEIIKFLIIELFISLFFVCLSLILKNILVFVCSFFVDLMAGYYYFGRYKYIKETKISERKILFTESFKYLNCLKCQKYTSSLDKIEFFFKGDDLYDFKMLSSDLKAKSATTNVVQYCKKYEDKKIENWLLYFSTLEDNSANRSVGQLDEVELEAYDRLKAYVKHKNRFNSAIFLLGLSIVTILFIYCFLTNLDFIYG